jgi:hypothetical protein
MNKTNRKTALEQLTKQAALNKIAEDVIDDVNAANIEDPQQFADKVFQKLLENMQIEGLEDLDS